MKARWSAGRGRKKKERSSRWHYTQLFEGRRPFERESSPLQHAWAYRRSMSTIDLIAESTLETPYQLRSIVLTATPEGGQGTWYRYVIEQGSRHITGLRAGSEAEVDVAVREMIAGLNERSSGKNKKKPKPTRT